MKKLLFTALLALIALTVNAETYKYLIFTMTDGTEKSYETSGLKLTYATVDGTESILVWIDGATTDTITYADVTNMYFSNETTGIDGVTIDEMGENDVIYDLNGRAMGTDSNALPKGVYIRNGKRFILK